MLNINKLNKRIVIKDSEDNVVRTCYASVSNMSGMEVAKNNIQYEEATTRFIVRYTKTTISNDMYIEFDNHIYDIQYSNNYNFANESIEIVAKRRSYVVMNDED